MLKTTVSLAASEPDNFGIGGVFAFAPAELTIAELSGGISIAARITLDNAQIDILPGGSSATLTVTYAASEVSQIDESALVLFRWDDANDRWAAADSIEVDADANQVSALIAKLGTFTLGVPLPQGEIALVAVPSDVDLSAPQDVQVSSGPIYLSGGDLVADGTRMTVHSLNRLASEPESFGTIMTADEDPAREGTQVSTQDGIVSFEISPPDQVGSGMIVVSSVVGAAQGTVYFNTVTELDADDNGLPDYWERFYFGAIGQNRLGDPDGDGLTNIDEYRNGTDPTEADTDADGIPDGWEVAHGLNPLKDDAGGDPDMDSYTNY